MNRSRETGEDFQFLLQRYAAERFLYRLGESQHRERYVLKGAMLLVPLGRSSLPPDAGSRFHRLRKPPDRRRALHHPRYLRDPRRRRWSCFRQRGHRGRTLPGTSVEPFREHQEYDGFRALFWARISGARIRMRIDVGFGNAIQPQPTDADYPTLLDAPHPQIRVYPREAVVAEKLHAMVVLGERNSRYKDFYDLHALAQCSSFEGENLLRAMGATFDQRRTAITQGLPVALTPRFYEDAERAEHWRTYLDRNELPGAPPDFGIVGEGLLSFLREPWEAMARGSGFTGIWPVGGRWCNEAGR